MKILQINLQNFRNFEFATVELEGKNAFLIGSNGQGKTNCLEAIHWITALRSFRSQTPRTLIRQGQSCAQLFFKVDHESLGETDLILSITPHSKAILLDENKVTRFADFIGLFPSVVLCNEDIHLIRGSPNLRRRFVDLTLSSVDPSYFSALRTYHRTLQERNNLLKNVTLNLTSLSAFEKVLIPAAITLCQKRQQLVSDLSSLAQRPYQAIAGNLEEYPEIIYQPDIECKDFETYASFLHKHRARDVLLKASQRGPHRDDFTFKLKGQSVREFASEGQQRTFVIALKLAQIDYFKSCLKTAPVVLADDILGQLDTHRQKSFWSWVHGSSQIICTGTSLPSLPFAWSFKTITVQAGDFLKSS